MNTFMWESPFTAQHLGVCTGLGATVRALALGGTGAAWGGGERGGVVADVAGGLEHGLRLTQPLPRPSPDASQVVPPVSKRLACGDVGTGGMAAPEDIAAACRDALPAAGLLAAE